jgi:hypothetical protein
VIPPQATHHAPDICENPPVTTSTPTWHTIELPAHTDARGTLSVAEAHDQIPFDIKRVYYLYNLADGAQRGAHATFGSQQVLIPVHGGFDIEVFDGTVRESLRMERPNQGFLLGSGVWRELGNFAADTVVLVVSSTTYADTEYCRDYDEFLRRVA